MIEPHQKFPEGHFNGVEEKSGEGEFELSVDDVKGTVWISREGWDAMTEMWDRNQ